MNDKVQIAKVELIAGSPLLIRCMISPFEEPDTVRIVCRECRGKGEEMCEHCWHEHDCEECNGRGWQRVPESLVWATDTLWENRVVVGEVEHLLFQRYGTTTPGSIRDYWLPGQRQSIGE